MKTISAQYISSFINDTLAGTDVNRYAEWIHRTEASASYDSNKTPLDLYKWDDSRYNFTAPDDRDHFHNLKEVDVADVNALLNLWKYTPSYLINWKMNR